MHRLKESFNENQVNNLIRQESEIKVSTKFVTEKRVYNKQYGKSLCLELASLYWFRLEQHKSQLIQVAQTKWKNRIESLKFSSILSQNFRYSKR